MGCFDRLKQSESVYVCATTATIKSQSNDVKEKKKDRQRHQQNHDYRIQIGCFYGRNSSLFATLKFNPMTFFVLFSPVSSTFIRGSTKANICFKWRWFQFDENDKRQKQNLIPSISEVIFFLATVDIFIRIQLTY